MTNPEFAALIEKQHLKECEDHDYMMMEHLLQTRCSIDDEDYSPDDIHGYSQRRILRRETAIELPITPSKSANQSLDANEKTSDFSLKNEKSNMKRVSPVSSQNSPRNSQYQTYLNPVTDGQRLFKKSSESLQKNSSTETDYSQPYKVIKQGSTETQTSINSSFAIDNSSINNDLSLDFTDQNQTVIENINNTIFENVDMPVEFRTPTLSKRAASLGERPTSKLGMLKKQFSIDHSSHRKEAHGARPRAETLDCIIAQKPNINPSLLSAKLHILQESSSTSTEEKDEINIPSISTNTVQDEIAKLSSTIKSSTEDDKDPPFNETMC